MQHFDFAGSAICHKDVAIRGRPQFARLREVCGKKLHLETGRYLKRGVRGARNDVTLIRSRRRGVGSRQIRDGNLAEGAGVFRGGGGKRRRAC